MKKILCSFATLILFTANTFGQDTLWKMVNGNVTSTKMVNIVAQPSAVAMRIIGRTDGYGYLEFMNAANSQVWGSVDGNPAGLGFNGLANFRNGIVKTLLTFATTYGSAGTFSNHPFKLFSNSQERMTITTDGNVGIGTSSPYTKLAVNGEILATKVRVTTAAAAWPDYVFHENYPLTPLQDIELYIKKHKHLPNIPNAQEVEKDGIDLGEMNKKLLEKIEELTLHLIQQQKIIEDLNTRVKKVEQQ